MNKEEKYIHSSGTLSIYSSTIAQYTNTDSNTTSLFYANKEKNFLYFKKNSQPIIYVDLTIDGVELNALLPDASTGTLFIDITEIIRSLRVTGTHTMRIYVLQGSTSFAKTFNIIPMQGYNYDNLAQMLSLAQDNFCDLRKLANCNYSRTGSSSEINPPTKIIVPFENGLRKFNNVQTLSIPCYNNNYGISNVEIDQYGRIIASAGTRIYNMLTFNINYLQGLFNLRLLIIGSLINKLTLEAFDPAKKYVAVKWAYPYTNSVNVKMQGAGSPNFLTSQQFAITFFELAQYEEEQAIIDLEDTGGEMPYIVNSGKCCKLRMTNLNAYDYIYYSQILKSEKVEILFNENLSTSNYQHVKLEKSKITLPTNGTELYNLEFNVILSEND